MRAGDARTLVVIEHVTVPASDRRGTAEKWEEFAKAWCKCEVEGGDESQPNDQTVGTNTWTLTTHWTPKLSGVTTRMRVLLSGKTLPIQSVVNVLQLNRELVFTCEETS
jgi:SPP1 family predicted phage head-tail adaptor